MLDRKKIHNLVGIQYKHHGRLHCMPASMKDVFVLNDQGSGLDCLGLILLIYKENGFVIPDYVWNIAYGQKWYRAQQNTIFHYIKKYFYEIKKPEYLDAMMFRCDSKIPNHIGVCLGNNAFIHVLENGSVTITQLSGYWSRMRYGYYRYNE